MLRKLSKAGFVTHLLLTLAGVAFVALTPKGSFGTLHFLPGDALHGIMLHTLLPSSTGALQLLNAAFILLLGLFINMIMVKYDLIPRQSFFAALIFVVLTWFSPGYDFLFYGLAATLLVLIALRSLMSMYLKPHPYTDVLNASSAIGLASLLIPETIVFIVFVWLGFFTLRITSWREWAISFSGFLLPYFYLAVYLFFTDRIIETWSAYVQYVQSFRVQFNPVSTLNLITVVVLAFLWLIVTFKILTGVGEKLIALRKRMWLITQFQWAAIVCIVLLGYKSPMMLPAIYVSLSMMLAYTVHQLKGKMLVYSILLGLFIVLAALGRFFG